MKKKALDYLLAFIIIISLNFLLPRLLPGDPLAAIYGEEALIAMTSELEAELIERFGLDKSLPEQFIIYLSSLLKADLGYSYYYETSVTKLILGALPWTLLLVGLGLVLSTLLGFILGLESGWNRGRWQDKGILTGLMLLNGFPDFFIGILLLLVFAVSLGIFPLSGALTPYTGLSGFALVRDILWHLSLPLAAVVLSEITASYLLTRTTVITILGEPFILTARAKGLKDTAIRYRHVGKNSLLPILTRTGIRVGRIFAGAIFIEIVFAYPGLGVLIFNSLMARDYPVLQGIFLLVAIGVLATNFIVDLLYKKIDPRVV
ncbi:MAG: peptide/nickel transport system permease protein [Clostridia bacterium]|nr:binding-protein-dependent transport system inner rane component [Clostridiales bacterium]MDK2985045.1 peptide/nickel transport system permease protein [Clostridia bacterium]